VGAAAAVAVAVAAVGIQPQTHHHQLPEENAEEAMKAMLTPVVPAGRVGRMLYCSDWIAKAWVSWDVCIQLCRGERSAGRC